MYVPLHTVAVAIALWANSQQAPPATPVNVGILLFEGVQVIDFAGPWEIFDTDPRFRVFSVAETRAPLTTVGGMLVVPNYALREHPEIDVLVLPGGEIFSQLANPVLLRWIREQTGDARITLTVCAGAFFLAKAGLLDGLGATTTAFLVPSLQAAAPAARVVADRRYVDNGRIVTAGGLTAGLDASLHVVEKLFGRGPAQRVALSQEYAWNPDASWARALLADRYVPDRLPGVPSRAALLRTEGNQTGWSAVWSVESAVALSELSALTARILTDPARHGSPPWHRRASGGGADSVYTLWEFADSGKTLWEGRTHIRRSGQGAEIAISVERTGRAAPAGLWWKPRTTDPRLDVGGARVGDALPPALDTSLVRASELGHFRVRALPARVPVPANTPHPWEFEITDAHGVPVGAVDLRVGGGMPQHGHGLGGEFPPAELISRGKYRIGGFRFGDLRGEVSWSEVRLLIRAGLVEDLVVFNVLLPPRPGG